MSLTTYNINFKIGEEQTGLPAFEPGSLLFTTDTNNLYLDLLNKSERTSIGIGKNSISKGTILGSQNNTIFNKMIKIVSARKAPRLLDIISEIEIFLDNGTTQASVKKTRNEFDIFAENRIEVTRGAIFIEEEEIGQLNIIADTETPIIEKIILTFNPQIEYTYSIELFNNQNYIDQIKNAFIEEEKNTFYTQESVELYEKQIFYTDSTFSIESTAPSNERQSAVSYQYKFEFDINGKSTIQKITVNQEDKLIKIPNIYTLETIDNINQEDIYSFLIDNKEYNFFGKILLIYENSNIIEVDNFIPINEEETDQYIWFPYRTDMLTQQPFENKKYQLVGGSRAQAQGNNAFAFGDNVIADGDHSISIGSNTTAGHMANANGKNVQALGEHSFGKGEQIFALGSHSIAFGKGNTNINQQISKEQFYETFWNTKDTFKPTAALDYMSFANGEEVLSLSQFSTTFGKQNKSLGDFSFTLGENNETFGNHAVTFGKNNHNNGESSLVFGQDNFNAGLKNGLIYGNNNTIQSFSKYNKNNIATWDENYFYYYDMDEKNQYIPITNSDFEKEEVYKPNNNAIGNFIIGNNNIVNVRSGETEEDTLYFKNNIVLGTNNNIDDIQLLNNLILGNNILSKPNNIEISTPTMIKDSIIFGTTHYAPNSQVYNSFLGGTENQITDRENSHKEQFNIFAFGNNLIANQNNKFVIGQYNNDDIEDITTTRIFSVGNGDGENNRNNAFVVYNNGEAIVAEQGSNEKAVVQKQYVDNLPRVIKQGRIDKTYTVRIGNIDAYFNYYKNEYNKAGRTDKTAKAILLDLHKKVYTDKDYFNNYTKESDYTIHWFYNEWSNGMIECWCNNAIPFSLQINLFDIKNPTTTTIKEIGVPAFSLPDNASIRVLKQLIPLPFTLEWPVPTVSCAWNFSEWAQINPEGDNELNLRMFVNANSAEEGVCVPVWVLIQGIDENHKTTDYTPTSDADIKAVIDEVTASGKQCYIHVKGYKPGYTPNPDA